MYGGTRTPSSGLKLGNPPQNTIHIYLSKYQNFLVSTIFDLSKQSCLQYAAKVNALRSAMCVVEISKRC